ncbi:subclass B3 metallo-beta-lactamase [Stenotrophomonas sp. NLF4-10]|uniref:subclass B3 metallo-beta-lactamase n=1 Tax=Stenotrophomonas sp. NLF4-10 TaxID=2918754 RepID=UPI001EFADDE1|nr:subclass B3 metallo-beta-lactamase [Stenotrophomonas sp. NLF4-10]MCG8276066.1 subclass B3 metallo-beta-lactamase [Stenotrophomonas sp. NLF4-10]
MTTSPALPNRMTRRLPGIAALAATVALAACQAGPRQTASAPDATGPTHAGGTTAAIPACPADATVMEGWNDRAPPRRIFGNTWYVGTCGLSALLVTSDRGHILIDGATEAAGPLIEANIRALGFDPNDVEYLLNSHEHYDHAAGLAYLQGVTGATLLAREPAVATLHSGRSGRDDPQQLEPHPALPPVPWVEAIGDGDVVRVGPLALTAHATPGHTPGGTSWTWRSCEGTRCLDMAYTDSTSAISDHAYRYLDHPAMVAAFRRGLDTLAALPCDIQITPHPLAADLFDRLQGTPGKPLVDAGACERYARAGRANLEKRLDDETRGLKP